MNWRDRPTADEIGELIAAWRLVAENPLIDTVFRCYAERRIDYWRRALNRESDDRCYAGRPIDYWRDMLNRESDDAT